MSAYLVVPDVYVNLSVNRCAICKWGKSFEKREKKSRIVRNCTLSTPSDGTSRGLPEKGWEGGPERRVDDIAMTEAEEILSLEVIGEADAEDLVEDMGGW